MTKRTIDTYVLVALTREWKEMVERLPPSARNRAKKKAVSDCAKSLMSVLKGWHQEWEDEV